MQVGRLIVHGALLWCFVASLLDGILLWLGDALL
jgi:hypothetical protein